MNNNRKFVTSSLPLAAFLVSSDSLEFRGIELTNPKSAVFVFDDPQGKGRDIEKDFSKGALVSALAYHTQLRILRGMLNERLLDARSGVTEQLKFKGNSNVSQQQLSR